MDATRLGARSGVGGWVLIGAIMGLLAGVVFIFFEMVVAKSMGVEAAGPLRMIAAIVLGEGALPPSPTVDKGPALAAGFIVHFVLSAIYGGIFGAIAGSVGVLRTNRWVLIGAAIFFGLVLWIVNFYVIGNILFPWFTTTNPLVQFFAHGFFYGGILGLLVEGSKRKEVGER